MTGAVVPARIAALLLALCLLAPGVAGARPAPDVTPRDPLSGLSLRQLAGQRIIVGYAGARVPDWLLGRVRRGEVGGVIAFTRNVPSRAALAAQMRRLQRARRPLAPPLLTMIDQEGGLVARLPGAPSGAPAQMGRRGASYVRRQGRLTAANLRRAGMNVNLAPVADLGRPGSYQARTGRAFARRPAAVASLATAFARGLQQGGVAATLKHFPGLGAVSRDEDALIQTVGLSRATLRAADEAPFAAGIRAGTRLVMTSTARYPALDGHARRAALAPDHHDRAARPPGLPRRHDHRRPRRHRDAPARRAGDARRAGERRRQRPAAVRPGPGPRAARAERGGGRRARQAPLADRAHRLRAARAGAARRALTAERPARWPGALGAGRSAAFAYASVTIPRIVSASPTPPQTTAISRRLWSLDHCWIAPTSSRADSGRTMQTASAAIGRANQMTL